MHSYIGKSEIIELVQNNRKGIMIENIVTNDIDEYINSLFSLIKSNNINTNVFTQVKIKKLGNTGDVNHKSKYIILLVIRKDSKVDFNEYEIIKNTIRSIVPCRTIQEWIKNKYLIRQ